MSVGSTVGRDGVLIGEAPPGVADAGARGRMSGYGPDARIWAGCSATGWMFGHGSDVQPRTECSGTGRWTCGRAAVRERSRPRLPGVYARAERRRSEERRVGKECRARRATEDEGGKRQGERGAGG